ncbi:MAG: ankyrin repeat domain-containing protein [Terracidiphilus sp.]
MANTDSSLRALAAAILAGDSAKAFEMLAASPGLDTACFQTGATRQEETRYFLEKISRYVYAGDTALHIAAAAYRSEIVLRLVESGADVHASNRLGDQPIHAAAVGIPGSSSWNPAAQATSILALIQAGADPNAVNRSGISPLHKAVRTRCATAVRTLLNCGADPKFQNRNGSDATLLATRTTGRGGAGSPQAKAEQYEIMQLLKQSYGD